MKLIIVNGPNLNLLGEREPEIYGSESLNLINAWIQNHELCQNFELEFFQSNSEGEIIHDGPVNTEQQIQELPISIREKLQKMDLSL